MSFSLLGEALAVQLVANGTNEVASGTYDTGVATPTLGYSLYALSGGVITSSTPLILITGGNFSSGAYALGLGSSISLAAGSTVSTSGSADAKAIFARDGAIINVGANTEITTSGANADGLYAFLNNATINATDVSIITHGTQANGVQANDAGRINVTGSTITTNGIFAHGIYAIGLDNPTITASQTNVTVNGASSSAAEALQGTIILDEVNLNVGATVTGGRGLYADNTSTILMTNGSITINGNSSSGGVYARGNSSITLTNVITSIAGMGNYGIEAIQGGLITINGGSIDTSADGEMALYSLSSASQRSLINASNFTITTYGNAAYGAYARSGGDIVLTDSTIETYGENAYGLYATPYSSGVTSIISVEGGAIETHNATAIVSDNTILNTTLRDTTVTGNGSLLSAVNAGVINLESYNSTLTGSALLDSATNATSSVSLFDHSIWNMSANSVITNLLNDNSTIFFTPPSGSIYKTLTVDNYVGNNGLMQLNTFLNGSSSPSDMLIINNGSATGTTGLIINNTGGAGALTTGDGILVVDALGGATTSSTAFSLASPAVSGPFEYFLYRSSLNGDNENNWYLRSICPASNPECVPEPPAPPVPANYRIETLIYPTLAATTLLYGQNLIGTLHERVGQDDWSNDASTNAKNRVWGRLIGLHGNRNRVNHHQRMRGVSYDYNFSGLQLGGDLFSQSLTNGSSYHLGGYGAFGRSDGDVKRFSHYIGNNLFTAYTVGAYGTYYSPTKAYIDTVLQTTFYTDMNSSSFRAIALDNSGVGFAASVEGGYPLLWKQQWVVEPQGQLIYQFVNLDDTHDVGAKIRFRDNDSLAGRLGVRLANEQTFNEQQKIKKLTTWFRPNFWYQFQGDPKAQFTSVYGYIPFQSQLEGASMEFNLGTTVELPKNTFIYANASYTTGLNLHVNAYNGQLGFKVKLV